MKSNNGTSGRISPIMSIGLIIVIILSVMVFFQYKMNVKMFKKKAVPEKGKIAAGPPPEAAIPQEPILVKVYKTKKDEFNDNLPLMGTVKGSKEINLGFEVPGVIDSFNFKEGERIEAGEIIATLNQKDALLKLRYNEIELQKTQKLFDIGAIAKAKLEQVTLEMESAKRDLDKTYLYAPQGGVLGAKDVEIGEFVTSNDRVAALIDDKEVFVEVGIVEKDIGKVKVGQKGKVSIDTYPDMEFDGTVYNVTPVVEGKSRTQTARIKVKNPKQQLLAGMFARATVAVYSSKDFIVIPNTAIDRTEDGYVVYVVKKLKEPGEPPKEGAKEKEGEPTEEEGVAEARPVEAAYRSPDFFVIKSGLEESELVVVETQEKLKDKYKVIITEVQEAIF